MTWLSHTGADLIDWAIAMNLWTLPLLAAAWLADHLLAPRVAARYRVALYAAVLVRLVLPLDWSSGVGVIETELQAAAIAGPTPVIDTTLAAPPSSAAASLDSGALALLVWAAGAALLLAARLRSARRLDRALRSATAARDEIAALAPGHLVLEHSDLGPAAIGLLRPRIVIPSWLGYRLPAAALAHVVRHEVAHVRRRDAALVTLAQLTAIVCWPVAATWLALARVRRLVEMACDEAALAGEDAAARRDYGETLLAVADAAPVSDPLLAASAAFGRDITARLSALRHSLRWPRWTQAFLVGGVAFGLPLLASLDTVASPSTNQATVQLHIHELRDAATVLGKAGPEPSGRERGPRIAYRTLDLATVLDLESRLAGDLRAAPTLTMTAETGAEARVASEDTGTSIEVHALPTAAGFEVRVALDIRAGERTSNTRLVLATDVGAVLLAEGAGDDGRDLVLTIRPLAAAPVPISIALQGADIKDVLRHFSEVTGYNVVIHPDLDTTLSIRLEDTSWRLALDEILRGTGYGWQVEDDVIRITPIAEIGRRRLGVTAAVDEPSIVSIDLKDADITDVIQYFGDVGKLTVVRHPEVRGLVTVRLIDVPWPKALDSICVEHGLESAVVGEALMVAPTGKLGEL